MHSLSIFGTSSDAGKSTLAFALTYLFDKHGIKVAPFKAQNVSNNSQVTDINTGEIAIPQAFAAEAIGLQTRTDFNPILLKSGGKNSAHVIVDGKSIAQKDVHAYYRDINTLKPFVKEAFKRLKKEFSCIIAEGAGSPVELNLMQKDLSNIYVAEKFNTKIILVADIERGGVFASIYGVYNLLPKKLRANVIGVIVNKFRGDSSLFDAGIDIIEEQFKIPVLGLVPYKPFNLGFEDAQSLINYNQESTNAILQVAVIALPHMSNFTDFEPLVVDTEVELIFITNASQLHACDLCILPGSKRVVDDLTWLRARGFVPYLQSKEHTIIAICGGYEMLHERLLDPYGVESACKEVQGIGRFKGDAVFAKEKILKKGSYNLWGIMADGYEIHNATTKKRAKSKKNLYGTFVHGFFASDSIRNALLQKINPDYKGYNFQAFKAMAIADFATHIDTHVDINAILKSLQA